MQDSFTRLAKDVRVHSTETTVGAADDASPEGCLVAEDCTKYLCTAPYQGQLIKRSIRAPNAMDYGD